MKTILRIPLARLLLATATATATTAATAGEPAAPIPPPRPGLVESPKGDGRQLTPFRRVTHEERFNAALRAAQRRRALATGTSTKSPTAARKQVDVK
jgi:hypothetical protein